MAEVITNKPAVPEPWVFDSRGLTQGRDGRWRFTIFVDEGSSIASGPLPPKIPGFACHFAAHTPTQTHYSYYELEG